jgi:hypothetical protein
MLLPSRVSPRWFFHPAQRADVTTTREAHPLRVDIFPRTGPIHPSIIPSPSSTPRPSQPGRHLFVRETSNRTSTRLRRVRGNEFPRSFPEGGSKPTGADARFVGAYSRAPSINENGVSSSKSGGVRTQAHRTQRVPRAPTDQRPANVFKLWKGCWVVARAFSPGKPAPDWVLPTPSPRSGLLARRRSSGAGGSGC